MILGRRGPAQAAFTNPELRELGELERADVVVDPAELELDPASAAWLESDDASPTARRNVDMLREFAAARAGRASRTAIELRFLPLAGRDPRRRRDGPVTGLRVVRNRLEPDPRGGVRAVATGEQEVIPCGLVIRSIGYRGRPLPGRPVRRAPRPDPQRRRPRVRRGRHAAAPASTPSAGSSAARPASSARTRSAPPTPSRALLEDLDARPARRAAGADGDAIEAWLRSRVPGLVTWRGWQAIDEHERASARRHGRPRVKLVRVPEMLAVAGQKTGRLGVGAPTRPAARRRSRPRWRVRARSRAAAASGSRRAAAASRSARERRARRRRRRGARARPARGRSACARAPGRCAGSAVSPSSPSVKRVDADDDPVAARRSRCCSSKRGVGDLALRVVRA